MTFKEVSNLPHGLYRLFWSEQAGGGSSLAAVGSTYNGTRWMAPINWTCKVGESPGTSSAKHWHKVERAKLLKS